MVSANVSASVGATINSSFEDVSGRRGSLVNNFTASANGCSKPCGPTMFGPLRSCMYPKVFRSTSVRNAIAKRIGTIRHAILIINIC